VTPQHRPLFLVCLFVSCASLALLGCMQTQPVLVGTPHAPKPDDCPIRVVSYDAARSQGYEQVGIVSMTAPTGTSPFDDSIRRAVQPKACAMGGEAVTLMGAGGGLGPIAPQGMAFAVWAKGSSGSGKPVLWSSRSDQRAGASLAQASPPAAEAAKAKSAAPVAGTAPPPRQGNPPAPPLPESSFASATTTSVDSRFAIAAGLGYSSDNLNVGLSARAGKTLPSHIYLGGELVYNLGGNVSQATSGGYSAQASYSAFYIGPVGGYDFVLAPVVVRPYVGLGMAWLMVSASASGPAGTGASASATDTKFVLWPGATVLYPFDQSPWFLAGDVRFVTVPGGPAFGLFAAAGMHL
jgi:hypothetical protein